MNLFFGQIGTFGVQSRHQFDHRSCEVFHRQLGARNRSAWSGGSFRSFFGDERLELASANRLGYCCRLHNFWLGFRLRVNIDTIIRGIACCLRGSQAGVQLVFVKAGEQCFEVVDVVYVYGHLNVSFVCEESRAIVCFLHWGFNG
ncbi:MAG: hypothetical protein RR818_00555 [Citrobacter sp.]